MNLYHFLLYKNKIWTSDSRLLLLENPLSIHSLVVVTLWGRVRAALLYVDIYWNQTTVINILHWNWVKIDEPCVDPLTCTNSPPTSALVVVRTLLLSFLVNVPFSMSPSITHTPWLKLNSWLWKLFMLFLCHVAFVYICQVYWLIFGFDESPHIQLPLIPGTTYLLQSNY